MAFPIVQQGMIAQQAATGTVTAMGGSAATGRGAVGGFPPDGDPLDPYNGNRRPVDPGLAGLGLVILKLLENLTTNRYKDNKDDKDKPNCKLFPYKDRSDECKGGKAHHIVPDRCWRSPGTRGQWTSFPPIDAVINNAREAIPVVGQLWKGGYYRKNMDEENGLSICVTSEQHRAIHDMHDKAEKIIGDNANPKYTTSLKVEEELGAKAVSNATGCSEAAIAEKLREYHQGRGFSEDTLVRADPYGQSGLTIDKFNDLATNRKAGGIGF